MAIQQFPPSTAIGGGGGVALSAGTSSVSSGTVTFANSNGVSFGLSNGVMTATVTPGAAAGVGAVVAGTQTLTSGTLSFGDSNGISFGMSNSSLLTMSHRNLSLDEIQAPANDATWLMGARQVQMQWGVNASNFTTATNRKGFFEIDVAMSSNTANVDVLHVHQSSGDPSVHLIHLEANGTNAIPMHIEAAGAVAIELNKPLSYDGGTVPMILGTSQSNLVSNLNANYLQGKVSSEFQSTGAYLTTAANSTHSHGNPTLALTNLTGTTASASNGFTLSLSANAPGGGGVAIAGSNTTYTSGTVILSDQTNITIGSSINGASQYLRFSVGNYITTGRASTDAIGLNTAATSVTWTVNSSGISLNAGAYLTTAALSTHTHGSGPSITGPISVTSNSSAWSISVSNYITTARASTDAIGLNTAATSVTWTVNSSGISLNAGAYLTTAMLSGNTSLYMSTSERANYFYTSNNTFANSTHSHGNPTLNLTNLTGTTASNSAGFTLSLSANAPGAAAENNWFNLLGVNTAGNTTASGSTIGLSGINCTLSGTNGSQIVVSVAAPAGGAGYTAYTYQNRQLGASTTINSAGGQNSLWLVPFRVAVPISGSTILAAIMSYSGTITSAATAQAGHTIRVALYSQLTDPASTSRFDTLWTGAASITFWNSGTSSYSYAHSQSGGNSTGSSAGSNLGTASVMGVRHIMLPIGSTIQSGLYYFGLLNSSSSAGYSAAMSRMALYMDNPMSVGAGSNFGTATNVSYVYADAGTYLTTTGALPNTIAVNQTGGVANLVPYFKIGAL
jgi:hypothetical protein